MAGNVTLSSSVRQNLLSLQNTSKLINQTQGRLSTGLKVAGPVDDPVAYFQAKSLNDRATDFSEKKDSIDQGISTVTAAINSVDAIESLVKQLKGLALTAKSATTTSEVSNVIDQFNDLKVQIDKLASDATYQGLNLVNGTGAELSVTFSNDTASALSVESRDIRTSVKGLNITDLEAITTAAKTAEFNYEGADITELAMSADITMTLANSADLTLSKGSYTFSYGDTTFTFTVATTDSGGTFDATATGEVVLTKGAVYTFTVTTGASAGNAIKSSANINDTASVELDAGITGSTKIGVGFSSTLNGLIANLEDDLNGIRSIAQQLGSNVALLQTRLDFTEDYVNTLTAGAGKLSLADLNEEGANLLALQTRQQLGIQALSFAGQSEQGILGLFR